MRARPRPGWMSVVWLMIFPSIAYAQASITGTVKDTSGAVLPGVTVEAASPALIEKTRSVVSDGTGQYRIENLRPGTYTVTFTLPGFNAVKREGIELTGSFTASVNAELRVGALAETITVTAETPLVDVQSTTRQRVLGHDVLDALPTARVDRDLALLIPGVAFSGNNITQDVGGTADVSTSTLVAHGSRGIDQRLTLNGLPTSNSNSGGQFSVATVNVNAYQEITFDTAGVSAELATGGVRVNYIPRDGGNTFKGSFFAGFANQSTAGSNLTQALKDRGLSTPDALKRVYDVNPGLGGPLKKDKLWFYTTARFIGNQAYPAGSRPNLNANNPTAWIYVPDSSQQPFNDIPKKNGQVRLTWQVTPKNKFGAMWEEERACYCSGTISATTSPDAAIFRRFPTERNRMVDWTSPLTNRLLLEAAMFHRIEYLTRNAPPGTNPSMVAVTDQALGNLVYRAPSNTSGTQNNQLRDTLFKTLWFRSAASYVTGAHAFKVGFNIGSASEDVWNKFTTQPFEFRFNNGVPNQITLYAFPVHTTFLTHQEGGLYAQDKWTRGRLTLSYGVRYDFYNTGFPEQTVGPGPLVPTRNATFPAMPGVTWKDITPKSGASYDLFGNGKTAVKVTLNKYLQGQGSGDLFGNQLNPLTRLLLTTTRSWNDSTFAAGDTRRGNFVPDCDLTNPAANGECGALANQNFGKTIPGATYDGDLLTGWGHRAFNWEFSTGVQHELLPRVSVDVSYFRRWYGNFFVTDNRAVASSDYTTFSLTAPSSDPRLPTAGSVITGLYDVNPARFGVPVDNYITLAKNYGKQIEHWNGVDATFNARPRTGMLLQGGVSTGRTVTDNCEVTAKVPESLFGMQFFLNNNNNVWTPLQFCHQQTTFLTQIKLVGAYTVSKIDVQIAGTVQSIPGPTILANYNAPNAVVAPSLGRPLSGNAANISVTLVPPGTLFGERMNELDLRIGKILKVNKTRTAVNLDVFNALNGNTVLQQNNTFGGSIPWQQPQSILTARFAKVSVQFDF